MRIDGQLRLHLDRAGEGAEETESGCSVGGGRRDGSDCVKKMTFKEIYAECLCARLLEFVINDLVMVWGGKKQKTARNLCSVSADSNMVSDLFDLKKKNKTNLLNMLFQDETIHYMPQSKYFRVHV